MSIINILDQQTANLIAAGEVVDRPAAVAKELLENAIDAGGTSITVEIKNGGSSLIRVSDNGKGMSPEDVKACVLRHATSKIRSPKDLEGIATLGFRGEALAAISSVSRFQIISKEPDADFGVCMSMEGEKTLSFDETGCPDGTTVTVRDIFFNVPARRKFLKKDATETAYISQYVERIAVSHPEIALKFIVDSRVKFSTPGNSLLRDTVYAVFGREFIDSLTEIDEHREKIRIHGFISLPESSAINRNRQIIYVNNRLVRSRIITYAVEDAYKSYIMTERYPSFVLFVEIDPYLVDINVHPTKLEVRFTDDQNVRESVYFAVKNKLESRLNPIKQDFEQVQKNLEKQILKNAFVPLEKTPPPQQQEILVPKKEEKPIAVNKATDSLFSFNEAVPKASDVIQGFAFKEAAPAQSNGSTLMFRDSATPERFRATADSCINTVDISKLIFEDTEKEEAKPIEATSEKTETAEKKEISEALTEEKNVSVLSVAKYCGVVFNTYVISEFDNSMYLIDKHAAHERILYEKLKKNIGKNNVQTLIDTRPIHLSAIQYQCAVDNLEQIRECGFELEEFGNNTLALRGIPNEFSQLEVSYSEKLLYDMIDEMISGKSAKLTKAEAFDRSLYTAACKAATKAGYPDSEESYKWLIDKLFECENVFCCPHGRPIIVKYTKSQVEKMFFRT